MNNKLFKNITVVLALLVTVSVFSSCTRNGYGCPYELKAPISIVKCIVK